eukprot:g11126.t1
MLPSPVPPPFEGDGNDPPLPTLPWGDMPHDSSDSEELLSPAGRNKRKEDRMVRKIYKKYTSETSDGERRDPSGASQSGNEMKRARRAAPPLVSGGSDSDSDQSWSYRTGTARRAVEKCIRTTGAEAGTRTTPRGSRPEAEEAPGTTRRAIRRGAHLQDQEREEDSTTCSMTTGVSRTRRSRVSRLPKQQQAGARPQAVVVEVEQ